MPPCLPLPRPGRRSLCGDSGGPAAQDHSEDHGGSDHHRADHQGCADRRERPPLVEGVAQLPPATASKNTPTVLFHIDLR